MTSSRCSSNTSPSGNTTEPRADEDVRPSVLIVGGFATMPPNYIGLRRRLLRRGAARVDICQLWPPDWLLAGMVGFGPVTRRAGRAIAATYRAGGRRPLIVIGHSAGGIIARLALSERPFDGRVAGTVGVAKAVGCLVTLGTPHGLGALTNRYRHAGHEAVAFLERESPGACFAPQTSYLTVAGQVHLASPTWPAGRFVAELFRMMVGEESAANGDGIVPTSAAHLDGARQLNLAGVRHGVIGTPWYGDEEVIDAWWPNALELWRDALKIRGHDSREALELQVAGWSSGSSSGS